MAWGLSAAVMTVLACMCGLRIAVIVRARSVRRRRGRANPRIDVGAVSSDWLAKQRVNREGFRP
jgi:hypothetical protein